MFWVFTVNLPFYTICSELNNQNRDLHIFYLRAWLFEQVEKDKSFQNHTENNINIFIFEYLSKRGLNAWYPSQQISQSESDINQTAQAEHVALGLKRIHQIILCL